MAYTSNLAFGCVPTGVHGVGLARIELTCGPDNDGSQRDAACCGFVREGVMGSRPPFRAAGGTPRSSEARVLVLRIRVGDVTMASSLIDVKSLPPGELR